MKDNANHFFKLNDLDSEESEKNDSENQETTEHHLKGIQCQCEKITVESEHDQENSEGESQEDDE